MRGGSSFSSQLMATSFNICCSWDAPGRAATARRAQALRRDGGAPARERGADAGAAAAGFVQRRAFHFLDDAAADHHAVGHRGDGFGGGGVADAEADADRQLHMRADIFERRLTSAMSMLPAPVTPLSET